MEQIETLLVDLKEKMGSLKRQMQKGFDGLNARFDTQALRLDRHAALIQTGSRWTARMNERSEKVDAALEEKCQQIADLTDRIRKMRSD
jgi:hypothetical protein